MSDKAQTYPTHTFTKDGVTYVPHFRNSAIYVGPGYPRYNKDTYSAVELMELGAQKSVHMLWSRAQHGVVNSLEP